MVLWWKYCNLSHAYKYWPQFCVYIAFVSKLRLDTTHSRALIFILEPTRLYSDPVRFKTVVRSVLFFKFSMTRGGRKLN